MNNQELKKKELKTAVLFLVFNRPDTTKQVFEAIRQAKPPRFYIAADGPREDKLGEAERVEEVRKIYKAVDWPCEVKTLFRKKNLGCKQAVSTAITWFFEQEEQGIILEDDCLPSYSFFWFCEKLLNQYKHDNDILSISGRNQLGSWKENTCDYFFSTGSIWGWATWARAWNRFDLVSILSKNRNELEKGIEWLKDLSPCKTKELIDGTLASAMGINSSWGYPWAWFRVSQKSINIISSINLVRNIGGDKNSTHTTGLIDSIPVFDFSISKKNVLLGSERKIDYLYLETIAKVSRRSIVAKLKNKLKPILRKFLK